MRNICWSSMFSYRKLCDLYEVIFQKNLLAHLVIKVNSRIIDDPECLDLRERKRERGKKEHTDTDRSAIHIQIKHTNTQGTVFRVK